SWGVLLQFSMGLTHGPGERLRGMARGEGLPLGADLVLALLLLGRSLLVVLEDQVLAALGALAGERFLDAVLFADELLEPLDARHLGLRRLFPDHGGLVEHPVRGAVEDQDVLAADLDVDEPRRRGERRLVAALLLRLLLVLLFERQG